MDVGKRHGHPRRVPCRDAGGRQGGAADQQVGPPEERRKPLREVVTPPVEAPSKPVRKDGPEKGGGVFTFARPPQRQRWRKGKGNPRRPRGHVRVDEARPKAENGGNHPPTATTKKQPQRTADSSPETVSAQRHKGASKTSQEKVGGSKPQLPSARPVSRSPAGSASSAGTGTSIAPLSPAHTRERRRTSGKQPSSGRSCPGSAGLGSTASSSSSSVPFDTTPKRTDHEGKAGTPTTLQESRSTQGTTDQALLRVLTASQERSGAEQVAAGGQRSPP